MSHFIQFQGFDFKIPVSPVLFSAGPISVHWYGLIIAAGLILAVVLAMRSSEQFGFDPDGILDLAIIGLPAAIVGARLYYVAFRWNEEFSYDWTEIYKLWHGGLAIYGGVIGALIACIIFCKVKKWKFLEVADLVMPYFIMAQAIGRWGNFTNQEAYGGIMDGKYPWGMTGDIIASSMGEGVYVHPTFLYESIWNLLVFAFLLFFRKKLKKRSGEVLFLYFAGYGLGRMFIEGLRTDSLYMGNARVSQVLSGIFILVFMLIFIARRMRYVDLGLVTETEEESRLSSAIERARALDAAAEAALAEKAAAADTDTDSEELPEEAASETENLEEPREAEENDEKRS